MQKLRPTGGSPIQRLPSDDDSQSLQSEFKHAFSEGLRTWEHRKASRGVDGPSRRKPASRFQEVEGALQTVPTYTRLSPGGHGGFDSGDRQSTVLSGSGAFHPTEPMSRLTYLQPCEHWLRLPSRASTKAENTRHRPTRLSTAPDPLILGCLDAARPFLYATRIDRDTSHHAISALPPLSGATTLR